MTEEYIRNFIERKLGGRHVGENSVVSPLAILEQPENIYIGNNVQIKPGVVLRPETGFIYVGNNVVINHYSVIHAKGGVIIGDWCIFGPHCGLFGQNHSYSSFDMPITKQPNLGIGITLMGDNWLGAHSVILDDVTLGKGAIIGANSTVTRSVPMASIAAGSPAEVVKKRYEGPWDFNKVERATATLDEMPTRILDYVNRRGNLIKNFIDSNDVVLDVGCGEGIITSIFADKCSRVIGCDYSAEALRTAKDRYPGIEFFYSNTTHLRFPDSSFTKVVLSDVAEHLLEIQLLKTLKEIKRVLVDDGELILTTPLTAQGEKTSTYAHLYEYSRGEIESILTTFFPKVDLIDNDFGAFLAKKS